MVFPDHFLNSLQQAPGFDEEAFVASHAPGIQLTSVRLNPGKTPPSLPFPVTHPVPWTTKGFYLPSRPSFTFDPLFHAGCYYVQEASSMFLEQAIRQCADLSADLKVLDLCAAPGGKSTHLQSLLSPGSLLVSNEVIRARGNVLRDNMVKWGGANVVVSHNDPAHFGALEHYFDIIVVDAPCSGSGLFRKDPAALQEWSVEQVHLCSQRQQRILADTWSALRPGGLLVYATCSYSVGEDEQIGQWLDTTFDAESLPLDLPAGGGIVPTTPGYRFWPHLVAGEGFFLACFRKGGGQPAAAAARAKKATPATVKESRALSEWIGGPFTFIRNGDDAYAWPVTLANDFAFLLDRLRVSYTGTHVGTFARDKLVPAHALAMSIHAHPALPRMPLDREQAIRYLQRREISAGAGQKGWTLATYEDMALGWVNILPNRVNNYYPKELRILRDI